MGFLDDLGSFLRDPLGKDPARDEQQAQQAAHANLTAALQQWQQYQASLDAMTAPYNDQVTNAMITRERDITGAASADAIDQARRLAGASGLGGGGGLQTQERLIRDEMARRNAATVRDVTATATQANSAWQQAMADLRGQATAAQTNLTAASPVNLQQPPTGKLPIGTKGSMVQPGAGIRTMRRTPEPTVAFGSR